MRNTGFATLAVVGVAAAVAVYALTQQPTAGSSLFSANLMNGEDMEFLRFVSKYGKSYGTKEELTFRAQQFKSTLAKLGQENSKNDNTFSVSINKFADWTPSEFKRILSYKPLKNKGQFVDYNEKVGIPESIDWRTKGVVNPVKDQQQCGSCWAFSAVAAMESRNAIASGKLLSLSEQQLVDCAGGTYGNEGCNGGDMGAAMQYAHDFGMMSEDAYPYTAEDGSCAYDKT